MAEQRATSKARWALRAGLSLVGVVAGLAAAEAAFKARDGGAFPHLNVYDPDPALGVRLRPGASTRIAFGGNAATGVRINQRGLRGGPWPEAAPGQTLVVGDSQVFGLGVEEQETFTARLSAALGAAALNLGVPTYGPLEYEKMLERWVPERRPKSVVLLVNLGNDLFEAERPNTERHAAWDGWAVRKETAPLEVRSFPGREWLFRESHLGFALRRWWYRQGPQVHALSMPSEGTFRDIASAAERAAQGHLDAQAETERQTKLLARQRSDLKEQLRSAQRSYHDLARRESLGVHVSGAGFVWGFVSSQRIDMLALAFAQPGDIVGSEDYGEWSQPLSATAEMIRQGAEYRKFVEKRLLEIAEQNAKKSDEIRAVVSEAARVTEAEAEAQRKVPPRIRAWSPLAPSLKKIKKLCDDHGARLLVVALPLDVQVSPEEWQKYGQQAVDLAPARILVDDLLDSAEALKADALDLTAALQKAQPGAYLQRDPHLSARGHEAVAAAIAGALARPVLPDLPAPSPGLPVGRHPPTQLGQARNRPEVTVPGSTAAGCETYIVDEWLTMRCHDQGVDKAFPVGVNVIESPLREAMIYRDAPGGAVIVQVPVLKGQPTTLDMRWPGRGRRLESTWKGNQVTVAFRALPADAPPIPDLPQPSPQVCACEKEISKKEGCGLLPVVDNPACFSLYKGDCATILKCLQSDPGAPVECPRGQAPVGTLQRCRPLCSKDHPCASGPCVSYQGAEVCL